MKFIKVGVILVVLFSLVATALPIAAQTQAKTHTVQPGETLSVIAARYGVTVEQLAFANGITNPNLIYAGQVLTIPTSGTGNTQITYTVVAGDTLYFIARRFGTTIQAIVTLNSITDPDSINVGQVLKIPSGSAAPTATSAPVSTSASATTAPTVAPTSTPTNTVTYVVKAGDTLGRIALNFGTTYQQIALLNNLSDPNLIYVGQTLTIRQGTVATPTPPLPTVVAASPTPITPTRPPATATTAANTPTGTIVPTATPIPEESATAEVTLPPGFQTPTAIVSGTQVPVDATNRFQNEWFEETAQNAGSDTLQVSAGWQPFFCDQPYTEVDCPAERQGTGNPSGLMMSQPIFQTTTASGRVESGTQAQSWLCPFRACQGGVFQTVDTIAGTTCEAGASVQAWSTNDLLGITSALSTFDDRSNSTWMIKVDLNGGVEAFSDTVVSSRGFGYDDGTYDQYAPISFTFTTTSTQTTIFFENLRLWPFVHNNNYIDNAYLRCTEP